MNGINPNDPVVAMLREIVAQSDQKLDNLADAVQDSLHAVVEGNKLVFQRIFDRLAKLEAAQSSPVREDDTGKEL